MYYPPESRPRALLFDLGDTLINFSATNPLPYIKIGTRLAHEFMDRRIPNLLPFNKYHAACRFTTYTAFVMSLLRRRELDLFNTIRRLHRRLGLPEDEDFLLLLAEQFYEPMKRLGTVEEGVHGILQALVDDGHPLGIVSNTMVPGRLLDAHLQEEGLLDFFSARIYSVDVGVKKPHPHMFLAALRALNMRPQGTLFIGDKLHLDVKGAQRMGMTTVLKVRKGPVPRGRCVPDHVIKHLVELPALLKTIGPCCTEVMPLLSTQELTRHYRPRAYRSMPEAVPDRPLDVAAPAPGRP